MTQKPKTHFKNIDKVNYIKIKNHYMGKLYKSSRRTNDRLEENIGNSDHRQRVISM